MLTRSSTYPREPGILCGFRYRVSTTCSCSGIGTGIQISQLFPLSRWLDREGLLSIELSSSFESHPNPVVSSKMIDPHGAEIANLPLGVKVASLRQVMLGLGRDSRISRSLIPSLMDSELQKCETTMERDRKLLTLTFTETVIARVVDVKADASHQTEKSSHVVRSASRSTIPPAHKLGWDR